MADKFCTYCDSKGVRHKKDCARDTATAKTSEAVSKNEFEAFKQSTTDNLTTILDILQEKKDKPEADKEPKIVPEVAGGVQSNFLPPNYQRIFEKYFDLTDGFEARLNYPDQDEKGDETGGITFEIIVPKKFWNSSDAYHAMYNVDIRTVAISPNNIGAGIENWCKKVQQNLRYDKKVKLK